MSQRGGRDVLNDGGEYPLEGTHLQRCGTKLLALYEALRNEPRRPSRDALAHMDALIRDATDAWKCAGRHFVMKFHILRDHLIPQMRFAGNITWTHNYQDESTNFAERVRATHVNRPHFAGNVLAKWYLEFLMELASA